MPGKKRTWISDWVGVCGRASGKVLLVSRSQARTDIEWKSRKDQAEESKGWKQNVLQEQEQHMQGLTAGGGWEEHETGHYRDAQ